jgi:DNA ligase-1
MLLADLVAATTALAATRSRTAKAGVLADLIAAMAPGEAEAAVGILLGRPRQGRIGVGWRRLVTVRESGEAPPAAAPSLTVDDVDAALSRVAAASGPGSASTRHTELVALLSRATEPEQELLWRALTGEVRTGALDGLVTDALARAVARPVEEVRRAVMLNGSLPGTVRAALADPASLAEVGLAVGTPVQPMLASTAADVTAAVGTTGEASVEYKLDGARIQVHRRGDDVCVFTRSLADITTRVPEIVDVARSLPVTAAILDGETLSLDESGSPRPFQETMSRFGAGAEREAVLAPWFFDVLHVDGRDLIDEPLSTRLEVLGQIAAAHRIPGEVTADPVVAQQVMDDALSAGHEGVVVKAVGSPYAAGRRGKSWVKVKPVHTYDLVVLAAEWGYGRREGWLSNLHLGAYDPDGVAGEPGGFVMVGKTFKGLTDELLRWQTRTFPGYAVRHTRGAVFVRPEIVVEIALDGVQRSPRYPGGLAMRFARVKRYRPDKTAVEADRIETLQAMLR